MKVEHFALQVPDPVAMADWYVKHLGFKVVRAGGAPAQGRFLRDESGGAILEIYHNPLASVPDYSKMDPLLVHLAFLTTDPAADRDRLIEAGAHLVDNLQTSALGDQLVMLRDPWGVSLQLVRRASAM